MYLIDSHCHLDLILKRTKCKLDDLTDIINRADDKKVKAMLNVGVSIENFLTCYHLIESYDNIACSVAIHPNNAHLEPFVASQFKRYLSLEKTVALGETGLDYYRGDEHKKIQQNTFMSTIELAQESDFPVIVHTRYAENDTLDILREAKKNKDFKAIIHCFSGSESFAKKALDLGCYISFSGILTFKNAPEVHRICSFIPTDRVLIETDSPYLAPTPFRGKICEPYMVVNIAQAVANYKNMELKEVIDCTYRNFTYVFDKFNLPLS